MSIVLRGQRAAWLSFDEEKWTRLGKDMDRMGTEPNNDSESKKNVIGETVFVNNGYTPSMSNENYKARTEDAIYPHIQYIADTLTTDEKYTRATLIVGTMDVEIKGEVMRGTGKGYKVPVDITITSDGGDTSGYEIGFTMNENGARTQGDIVCENGVPVLTLSDNTEEASIASAQTTTTKANKSNLS